MSGKNLKLYGNYLKPQWSVKKTQPFFDVYEKSILSKSIEDQCNEAIDVNQNGIQHSYITMLKEYNSAKYSIYLIDKYE